MPLDRYPVRRLEEDPSNVLDRRKWPAVLPPVAQVLEDGLDLSPATVLPELAHGLRFRGGAGR
jgi:hypothetical protein